MSSNHIPQASSVYCFKGVPCSLSFNKKILCGMVSHKLSTIFLKNNLNMNLLKSKLPKELKYSNEILACHAVMDQKLFSSITQEN